MDSPQKMTKDLGDDKLDLRQDNASENDDTQNDCLKKNEAEFFQHLNLSKCDASRKSNPRQPALARKQPLTRHLRSSLSGVKERGVCDKEHIVGDDAEPNTILDVDPELESKEADINEKPEPDDPQSEEDAGGESGDQDSKEHDETQKTISKEENNEMAEHRRILKMDMDAGTDFELLKKEESLKKEYPSPPYRCSFHTCTSEFARWEKFMRHLRKHTGQLPYSCVRCNFKQKFRHRSDLMSHLKRHLGVKTLKCAECGETFEKSRSLTSHMIARHGANDSRPRKFKCTECGDAFLSKMAVDRHIRCWHTGYRPKSCHICGSSFHTEYDLKTHLLIHSGEKPYKCEDCDYHARTMQLLKRHKKSHTKEKPYICKECDFTCSHSGSLKRHALTHLDTKPYKCPYCSHRCSDLNNLKKHIRKVKKHEGLKVYACSHCTYFSTDDGNDYLRHMKQYHFPYLDMRTATAAKVSGIFTEDVDEAASEELVNAENNLFNEETDTVHDQISLSDISRNTAVVLPMKNNLDDFPGGRGDIFLSSAAAASEDNGVTQEATFISGDAPFGEDPCLTQSLSSNDTESGPSNLPQPSCERQDEAMVKMNENSNGQHGIGMSQQYVAVLVNWPNNEKLQDNSSGADGPLTLVINSNPVLLGNPKPEDPASISPKSYFTTDWTCFSATGESTTQKPEHDAETQTNPS